MKTIHLITVLLTSILLLSCKDEYRTLRGRGKTTERNMATGEFNTISINDDLKVNIIPGNKHKVVLKGYTNLLDYVKTDVINKTLTVSYDRSEYDNFSNTNVEINIEMPSIINVYHSGENNVNLSNFVLSSEIKLHLSNTGNINARGCNFKKLNAVNASMGKINASDMQVKTAECRNNSSGSIEVFVNDTLKASIFSTGNIHYLGDPYIISEIKGSGKLIKK